MFFEVLWKLRGIEFDIRFQLEALNIWDIVKWQFFLIEDEACFGEFTEWF